MREGELPALTLADVDFERKGIFVRHSYARLNGEDVISDPKTRRSKRFITVPDFLLEIIREYAAKLYEYQPEERLFECTKYWLKEQLERCCKRTGVKVIRVHDIRHPYVKHTTKKYNSEKQKTQATKMDLIAWVFRFCTFNYSKRSWTL